MSKVESRIWSHYHKLQENLSELMDPGFPSQTRSFAMITLNMTYTNTEKLFELVEETTSLSKGRQAILAKLAHHIEATKDGGMNSAFSAFIKADLAQSLSVINSRFRRDFDLAS